MSVDKIVLRAFLSTLAAICALFAFMCVALCVFFPSTMMEVTYAMGMESSSIHFAERAYESSDDVYYIAYATEVAIEEGAQDKILSCGEKLLAHEGFEAHCNEKGEGKDAYRGFIYGKVCVAKYDNGNASEAIALAMQSLGENRFAKGNAVVAVLIRSLEKADTTTQNEIKTQLQGLTVIEADQPYLTQILALIN